MIFQWLLDPDVRPQDKVLLSLYDHGTFSPRQFCILAGWDVSRLRLVIHRFRKHKNSNEKWIHTAPTRFDVDRSHYLLGIDGLRYCGKKLKERVQIHQVRDTLAQSTHLLGLNEILIRLVQTDVDQKEIVWLATREASDYLYRLCRIQNKVNKRTIIRPDARFIWKDQSYWLEYDSGTEGPFAIEEKMSRYVNTLDPLRQKWLDKKDHLQSPLDQSSVIWVTKTSARKRYLENIWKHLLYLQYMDQEVVDMLFFVAGEETEFLMKQSQR